MKKIFTLLLAFVMIFSVAWMLACGNELNDSELSVVLVDVENLTEYDLKELMSDTEKSTVESSKGVVYTLQSVATETKLIFNDSIINLSEVYKECYVVSANVGDDVLYRWKVDFYDINNDGVVWCEMNDYTVGAIRTNVVSDITYEYVEEEFCEGDCLVVQPTNPAGWCYSYLAVMPYHSKEYYQKYTDITSNFTIAYVRKAVYDENSRHYTENMEHLLGTYATGAINVRYFGCSGNVQDTGARLNTQQTLSFRMEDVLAKFDVIGAYDTGAGSYWYFVGTCHGAGNPYKITYFLQYIEID